MKILARSVCALLLALLAPHQHEWAVEDAEILRRFGHEVQLFDREAMRAQVASPLFHGGLWDRTGAGILDPQKLALGPLALGDALIHASRHNPPDNR